MPVPFAKHLTSDLDFTPESLRTVLDLAHEVKRTPARFAKSLAGRYLTPAVRKALAAYAADIRARHQTTGWRRRVASIGPDRRSGNR